MIRISQILVVAGMAAMLSLAACASDGVSATDSQGTLTSEAELSCCQESAMDGKTECCGESIEGKYCPVTGQKVEE
jgi:hypothetical protein